MDQKLQNRGHCPSEIAAFQNLGLDQKCFFKILEWTICVLMIFGFPSMSFYPGKATNILLNKKKTINTCFKKYIKEHVKDIRT